MDAGRVLVTGATGFIGAALFRSLKSRGYAVDGVSLHGGCIDGQEVASLDLASAEQLSGFAEGREYLAIFHIAAQIPESSKRDLAERCFVPNIASAKNILDLTLRQKNCHLLYASSVSVYGGNNIMPLHEGSLPMPDNYYALSKYAGELLFQLENEKMPLTVFRICSPYGPGYRRKTVMQVFGMAAMGSTPLALFGSGRRRQDFIYIDDIVAAFVHSFENRVTGLFNLCSGKSVSMRELAELILSLLPESKSSVICSGREDPQEHIPVSYSVEKLAGYIGFTPKTPLEAGLRKYLDSLCPVR